MTMNSYLGTVYKKCSPKSLGSAVGVYMHNNGYRGGGGIT